MIEILQPQLAYAPYHVEEDIDRAQLTGYYRTEGFDASLSVVVCAEENTILLELNRTFPGLSASVSLLPMAENGAIAWERTEGNLQMTLRGFDSPELHFPTYGLSVLREVSRVRLDGRERIRYAVCIGTNHDTAAYMAQTTARAQNIDDEAFDTLLLGHRMWWENFWSKSAVSLPDETLELHWYTGLYIMACCARNPHFAPGLWGNFVTSDGMGWFGDYHLNYNYEAPFYALTAANHTELLDCYMTPLNDFLPHAKRYAKAYLGCRGAYFPVSIGPLGMETDIRPDTKEHGHLFLGQKSNAAYAAVIPMMHWYSTRDTEYARTQSYPYLRAAADFWEDYLTFSDGQYHIVNDALNEVEYYSSADFMPQRQDERNPIISVGLVRMLMTLLADMAGELGVDAERIPHWLDIAGRLGPAKTVEADGILLLRGTDNVPSMRGLCLQYLYPAEQIGRFGDSELYRAAQNTLEKIGAWDDNNLFCSFYPAAARLGYDPDTLICRLNSCIASHALPNGMFRFQGGGIENSAAVPATVNEMLLQSYEHILRLFPCWNRSRNAAFRGLRAYGAFVVNAALQDGVISADITSERGQRLRIEKPGEGYVLRRADGEILPLHEQITETETVPGEVITIFQEDTAL